MKLEQLLSITGILLLALACTKDDLVMNTDIAKPNEAYLSFNVNAESAHTKGGSSSTDDSTRKDEVLDCSLILFDENNTVLWAYDNLSLRDDGVIQALTSIDTLIVQVKLGLNETNKKFKLLVVANTAQTYAGLKTYTAVQDKLLNDADLNRFVKASDLTEVTVPKGFTSMTEARLPDNITSTSITVKQLTARVELTDFAVEFTHGTKPVDVQLKDVMLVNRNKQSSTRVDDTDNRSLEDTLWDNGNTLPVFTPGSDNLNFADIENKPSFTTFANFDPAQGEETAIRFTLVYDRADGEKEKTFEFVINRPTAADFINNSGHTYVRSGYIYQIKVDASLTSSIECSIRCYTKDWNYNQITYNY